MMESWRDIGEKALYGNDVSAWLQAAIVFAVWFFVLPFAKLIVTRRLRGLEPGQARGPLELVLALLNRTTRLFLIAVASWLALKSLVLPD